MKFSYKPLWKLLIDKEMSNKDLIHIAGISKIKNRKERKY